MILDLVYNPPEQLLFESTSEPEDELAIIPSISITQTINTSIKYHAQEYYSTPPSAFKVPKTFNFFNHPTTLKPTHWLPQPHKYQIQPFCLINIPTISAAYPPTSPSSTRPFSTDPSTSNRADHSLHKWLATLESKC